MRSSLRARGYLGALLTGYLAVAVVAGAPHSPLTVPLPTGARPPSWATGLAGALAVDRIGRPALIAVSIAVVALIVIAFTGLLVETWSGRVATRAVTVAAAGAILLSVAAPLLLSRDVFAYADAGRIAVVHHRDPYLVTAGSFGGDPFVQVTAEQWRSHHTVYGPAFTLVSEAIARMWQGSPGAVILAFKVLAGLGAAVALLCAWLAARVIQPTRAAFAIAVVGLNPVVIVHTVGGGHVDAALGALLVGGFLVAVGARTRGPLREVFPTICLLLACLVKIVFFPILVLWLWQLIGSLDARRRWMAAATHLAVILAVSAAILVPFTHGAQTLTPLASVGGLEWWASPAHFVGHTLRLLAGSTVGDAGDIVIVAGFLLIALTLLVRLRRRSRASADVWGAALILLALAQPFLLPWYACWFVPFLGLMRDKLLSWIGVAVSTVLAATLVPADPFRGYTSPAVFGFVHYLVAPVLLVLFALVVGRTWRGSYPGTDGTIDLAV
jgi:alpha-1,6-mannosyltransferase